MSSNILPRTTRLLRPYTQRRQCLSSSPSIHPHPSLHIQTRTRTRTLTSQPSKPPSISISNPHSRPDPITLHRLEAINRAHYKRRSIYSGTGLLIGIICLWATATFIELPPPPAKLDSSRPHDSLPSSKPVIQTPYSTSEEEEEVVPTGTSSIPTFPKTIHFSSPSNENDPSAPTSPPEPYQLLGLGIRTVSFLSIQVYIIGLYICTSSLTPSNELSSATPLPPPPTPARSSHRKKRISLISS
ncbi:putative Altered inheritance of mitochondria protein 18, mitochondrial [Sclerotinia borealis F-4128]|uniref:Putative Altered inheritance of mitochondria protein 18, mitochondrial n=1 Tax=Sclerotinia borealis (strain F-4128) TaxID=1432307 RepID=W9C953_SCLBF|nr:putative Altered inheritance of mitochondria protein 18, mitochondrial [Sclerotinia borealis F-4128]